MDGSVYIILLSENKIYYGPMVSGSKYAKQGLNVHIHTLLILWLKLGFRCGQLKMTNIYTYHVSVSLTTRL